MFATTVKLFINKRYFAFKYIISFDGDLFF